MTFGLRGSELSPAARLLDFEDRSAPTEVDVVDFRLQRLDY